MNDAPYWWNWPLEVRGHIEKRMLDRGFSETELRIMFDDAISIEPNHEEGRYLLRTFFDGTPWAVIVEPCVEEEVLIAVTAYRLS